ncbi:hypothetical protein EHS25_008563 [Saitozyma podzolica]|uniref:Uncharacterized protein n=1 Tax=Saitozyma podzolica TaxID=1890683 RepID=A0A427YLZ6_9TREE|nr:hypothetical protein EHS25_008563 [Saitozyma podzolica]
MQCFQQLLLLVLLLPIPSASPLFVLLFGIATFWSIGPCVYCIALCSIIFLSTSPSSPLTTRSPPHLAPNTSFPLTSPLPERFWIHLNHGRWADPGLVGYWEMSRVSESGEGRGREPGSGLESELRSGLVSDSESGEGYGQDDHAGSGSGSAEATPGQAEKSSREGKGEVGDAERDSKNSDSGLMTSTSTVTRVFRSLYTYILILWRLSTTQVQQAIRRGCRPCSLSGVDEGTKARSTWSPVPRDYLDLRFRGLGLVLDLGWRRSEEGLRWELDDWREATRRQHQARGKGGALWGSPRFSGEQDTSDRADGAEGGKVSRAGKVGRWLGSIIGRGEARNGGDGVGTKTGTGTGSDGKRKGGERSGFWATTPFVGAW